MKTIICKLTLFCGLFIFSLSLFLLNVKAVTLSPNSGTRQANGTETITLIANPINGETLVKLDLTFANATVLDFDPNSSVFSLGAFPECTNGQTYSATQVCASLASPQAIPNGAVIGTVSVKWGASGTATVTAGTGNLYRLTQDRIDSGLKATYSLGSIPATPLLETKPQEVFLIVTGSFLLLSGIYLSKQASKHERGHQIS